MKCPEFEELADWVDEKLAPAVRKKLEKHLHEGCADCQQTLAWLQRAVSTMKSESQLFEPPDFILRRALEIFPAARRKSPQEWIAAKLDFDSWRVPALQGIRAESRGPRQQVYVTEMHKIYLMSEAAGTGQRLVGQVIGPNQQSSGPFLIELHQKNKKLQTITTSTNGEFVVEAIPHKTFELRIHSDDESIVIHQRD